MVKLRYQTKIPLPKAWFFFLLGSQHISQMINARFLEKKSVFIRWCNNLTSEVIKKLIRTGSTNTLIIMAPEKSSSLPCLTGQWTQNVFQKDPSDKNDFGVCSICLSVLSVPKKNKLDQNGEQMKTFGSP